MPRSKKRKKQHDYHPPADATKSRKNRSAVLIAVLFLGLLGIGVAYFAKGPAPLWLLTGAILGVVGGYFFGKQVDKAFEKK